MQMGGKTGFNSHLVLIGMFSICFLVLGHFVLLAFSVYNCILIAAAKFVAIDGKRRLYTNGAQKIDIVRFYQTY